MEDIEDEPQIGPINRPRTTNSAPSNGNQAYQSPFEVYKQN